MYIENNKDDVCFDDQSILLINYLSNIAGGCFAFRVTSLIKLMIHLEVFYRVDLMSNVLIE